MMGAMQVLRVPVPYLLLIVVFCLWKSVWPVPKHALVDLTNRNFPNTILCGEDLRRYDALKFPNFSNLFHFKFAFEGALLGIYGWCLPRQDDAD